MPEAIYKNNNFSNDPDIAYSFKLWDLPHQLDWDVIVLMMSDKYFGDALLSF